MEKTTDEAAKATPENIEGAGGGADTGKDPAPQAAAARKRPGWTAGRVAAAIAATAVVAAALGAGICLAATQPAADEAEQEAAALEERAEQAESAHPEDAAQAACDHRWRELGLFEETDAVTHTEEHPEVTETVEVPHTVCNVCYAVVDGATAEHTAQTGHDSFTTDVPVPTTVVTQEAYSEEVVDQPAEQRFTPVLEWCPACGATRPAPEVEDGAQEGSGYEEGAVETEAGPADEAGAQAPEGAEWPEGYPYE